MPLKTIDNLCIEYFISKPNCIITPEELCKIIWNDKEIGDSTIRELINRIRKKVDGINIENVYSSGYILKR